MTATATVGLTAIVALTAIACVSAGTASAMTPRHAAATARFPLVVHNSFARMSGDQLLVQATVVNGGARRVGGTEGSVAWRGSAAQGLVSVTTFKLPALAKGAGKQLSLAARPPIGTTAGRYAVFVCLDIGSRIKRFSVATNCTSVETVSVQSVARARSGRPPNTRITVAPSRWTALRTARFSFKASVAKSSFECALDGSVWLPCASGIRYTSLAKGAHSFQVRAIAPTGATDSSPARATWTVDTVAPALTLTSPAAGATVHGIVTYAGSAGQAAGDLPRVTLRLWEGPSAIGAPLATVTTTASRGRWSFQASSLQTGQYTVVASQADQAGNRRTTHPVTFAFEPGGLAPTVTLLTPTNGNYSNITRPIFSGDAGTELTDSAVTVNIYAGTTASGTPVQSDTAVVGSGGAWTVQASTALADGTYTAQAVQTNGPSAGRSAAVTFTVDTLAPVVSITSPNSGQILNSTNLVISGSAGTRTGDLASVTVNLYAGPSATGTPQTLTATVHSGSWSVTPAALSGGTYTVQALQTDEAGNTGESSIVTFTVNNQAPTVTLESPSPGSYTNDFTPTFSGEGAPGAPYTGVTVKIYAGPTDTGTPVQTLSNIAVGSGGSWTATPKTALQEGTYTAVATQSNDSEMGSSGPVTFTVDLTPPAVAITSPANGAETNQTTPTISGTAGTAAGDLASITVDIYSGSGVGGTPDQVLTTTASDGAWTATATQTLGDGTYTAQATQSDQAGNTGDSTPVMFTVDTAAPTVTITSPVNGSYSNNTTPTFTGSAGTLESDSGVTLNIYTGTSATGTPEQSIPATRGSGSSWTAAVTSALGNGTYTAQAVQSNGSQIGSSSEVQFTVDITAPAPAITSPLQDGATNDTNPTISGTAGTAVGDNDTITVDLYSGPTPSGTPTELSANANAGGWSVQTGTLSQGTYTVVAIQSDQAGNTGTSTPVTFTVDTTPPAVAIVDPTSEEAVPTGTPTISGTAGTAAGDLPSITVDIYSGSGVSGTPVQTLTTTASDGAWTVTATQTLADGPYTAEATQSDQAGNTGDAPPVTFTISTGG